MKGLPILAAAAALLGLGGARPASAYFVMPTDAGWRYLACVEDLADRNTGVKDALLGAVARWRAADADDDLESLTAWDTVSRATLRAACGRAPTDPIAYDVVPYPEDDRPSDVIATVLVRGWSMRVANGRSKSLRGLPEREALAAWKAEQ